MLSYLSSVPGILRSHGVAARRGMRLLGGTRIAVLVPAALVLGSAGEHGRLHLLRVAWVYLT